jgi:hypothetical protein
MLECRVGIPIRRPGAVRGVRRRYDTASKPMTSQDELGACALVVSDGSDRYSGRRGGSRQMTFEVLTRVAAKSRLARCVGGVWDAHR